MNEYKKLKTYFSDGWVDYTNSLKNALENFDKNENLFKLAEIIWQSLNNDSEIHIFGNGGSAANASHIVGDYMKTFCIYKQNLKIFSLTDNNCYLTATANDIDYSEIFSFLIPSQIKSKDKIIFLSGSGNSSNLVKCALKAKLNEIQTIAITGYDGGKLAEICDLNINFKIDDMEIAEDIQLICFHHIKQYLCKRLISEKNIVPLESTKYNKRVDLGEVV